MATGLDAALAESWIRAVAAAVEEHRDELTELDTAIGDGDHGANLSRGFTAVTAVLDTPTAPDPAATPGALLTRVGTTLISKVGGASGPLYGSAFRAIGSALPPAPAPAGAPEVAAALAAGLAAVQRLGGAQPGDKTIVDAWSPALAAFEAAADRGLAAAATAAAEAAERGAEATVPLEARKGRASYLGPRSIGHRDPGATSTSLIFAALARAAGATQHS